MGIFIHAAWLIAQPEHAGQINDFLSYAMTHDNVYLVTISQVRLAGWLMSWLASRMRVHALLVAASYV